MASMCLAAVDLDSNQTVEKSEFRDLILHMAAADLHSRRAAKARGHQVPWGWVLLGVVVWGS